MKKQKGNAGENKMRKHHLEKKGENRLYLLSRAMTKVLRHTATALHLSIKPNGYVKIEELVKVPPVAKFKPVMSDIEEIVKTDQKQRLEISPDSIYIRAVQGHTMKVKTIRRRV
eukprot:TRINITY_DN14958_c0_g1_i5.p1 TRINITY_DN14958_c0_g1~~TRINITY_DN14958_c0_g1_i5.p1  ORF type:complete len:114 (-),score=26.43 TRINITY_DN14958_c0_g1_i5:630-971(-)